MDQSFYLGNRNADTSQALAGSQIYGDSVNNQLNLMNALYGMGQQEQNAPLNSLNSYAQLLSQFSGMDGTNTASTDSGGGATGALGGALGLSQLLALLNRGGTGNGTA